MPPTSSLRRQVLEAVATALRAITAGALYNYTVKDTSVVLDAVPNIMTVPGTELPFFIIEPSPEGSKFYMPAMKLRHQFQIIITARQDAPAGLSTSKKMETWEKLIADIEVALTRDITLGGIAADVRLLEATPAFDLGASSSVFVVQPIVVTLFRAYGSPWNS